MAASKKQFPLDSLRTDGWFERIGEGHRLMEEGKVIGKVIVKPNSAAAGLEGDA